MREGDKEYGILVTPDDPKEVAAGLYALDEQPRALEPLRRGRLRAVLADYTWERTA